MISKTQLRNSFLQQRLGQSPEEVAAWEQKILIVLQAWPVFQKAKTVALYAPIRGECPTQKIAEKLWARGSGVAMPRVLSKTEMDFAIIPSWEALKPGKLKIAQPGSHLPAVPLSQFDLILAPALAMDDDGFRLGYGGGFYDRLLEASPDLPVWGLIYSFQKVAALPHELHDKPLRGCVIETGWREAR